ncbi:hypothetical protein GCM10010497_54290 [Streptomyces cinereoruber]|uniref:Uncharacterized protein n=1 Tax=Streptomyces cinereoruber TaxID=67260 RepID=A0AAV4KS19_9ACTN|nr:hypothetical protein GCM10010497_54290 [Streptomyces cinereoruber]
MGHDANRNPGRLAPGHRPERPPTKVGGADSLRLDPFSLADPEKVPGKKGVIIGKT